MRKIIVLEHIFRIATLNVFERRCCEKSRGTQASGRTGSAHLGNGNLVNYERAGAVQTGIKIQPAAAGRASALFLRPNFLSAALVSCQTGEFAVFVLRELELDRPRLGKEFRIRLREHCKRPALVKHD